MSDNIGPDHPLWKRLEKHDAVLQQHGERLSVGESKHKDLKEDYRNLQIQVVQAETEARNASDKLNNEIISLNNAFIEFRAQMTSMFNTLKIILPLTATLIIAGVTIVIWLFENFGK